MHLDRQWGAPMTRILTNWGREIDTTRRIFDTPHSILAWIGSNPELSPEARKTITLIAFDDLLSPPETDGGGASVDVEGAELGEPSSSRLSSGTTAVSVPDSPLSHS